MRIIFVRHGDPNYQNDCLTELGHKQAEAVAKRLAEEGIEQLFSSPRGRAQETASHVASALGLPVHTLPFMSEIGWGAEDGSEIPFGGHPWRVAWDMAARGQTLTSPSFADEPPYKGNRVVSVAKAKGAAFDELLAELGYTREGEFYRVGKPRYRAVCVVSHAGSSISVIAHMLNLNLPLAFGILEPRCTAVTTLLLPNEEGKLFTPRVGIMNDARHIVGIETNQEINR